MARIRRILRKKTFVFIFSCVCVGGGGGGGGGGERRIMRGEDEGGGEWG